MEADWRTHTSQAKQTPDRQKRTGRISMERCRRGHSYGRRTWPTRARARPSTPTQNLPQPQVNRPDLTWADLDGVVSLSYIDPRLQRDLHTRGVTCPFASPSPPHCPPTHLLPLSRSTTSTSIVHSACFADTSDSMGCASNTNRRRDSVRREVQNREKQEMSNSIV